MLLLAIGNQRIIVAGIAAIAKPTVANHRITSATDCLPTRLNLPLRNLGHILG